MSAQAPVRATLYPRVVELAADTLHLISVGAREGHRDSNSIWSTRFTAEGSWSKSELVVASGLRSAFEPAVLATGRRIDLVWTRDLGGERSTHESIWHVCSLDGGRTWTHPRAIARGRHLWRPETVQLRGDTLALLYLESTAYGSPGTLKVMIYDGHHWRAPRRLIRTRLSDFGVVPAVNGRLTLVVASAHPTEELGERAVYRIEMACSPERLK
jgi:hypothetical protein